MTDIVKALEESKKILDALRTKRDVLKRVTDNLDLLKTCAASTNDQEKLKALYRGAKLQSRIMERV